MLISGDVCEFDSSILSFFQENTIGRAPPIVRQVTDTISPSFTLSSKLKGFMTGKSRKNYHYYYN